MDKELKRILCVDDDEDIRSIIKLCLEKVGGYDVMLCTDASSALSQIADLQPDLILLDMIMPNIDGLSVATYLKQDMRTKHIPIIFMTAKNNVDGDKPYQQSGACGVIAKPFDPMNLPQQIAEIWGRQHA